MPVKRRKAKGRMTPREEAEFWGDYFDLGTFLLAGWEDRLGLAWIPPGDREGWAAREPKVEAAGGDAWARLGRLYLDEGLGNSAPRGRGRWALQTFGEPGRCR